MVRDIVAIAAAGREFLPPRLRLRFLAAWRRALPPDLRAVWNAGALAPHEIERRARAHRRDAVERGAERWLRTSSRTQVRHDGKRVLVTRRDLAEEGQFDDTYSLRYRLPAPEAKACWLAAARLHEHGIPVAVPARFEMEGPHSTVYFELPAPVAEQDAPHDLETILELLHDRGLAIDRLVPGDLLRSTGGAVALVPPAKLISSEI